MLSARTIKKFKRLLILFSVMMPVMVAITFDAAEARRAYQTVDKQDFADESDTPDAALNTNDNSNDVNQTSIPKHVGQIKQDKYEKPIQKLAPKTSSEKQQAMPDQIATSPLDLMMQFENERLLDSKIRPAPGDQTNSVKTLKVTKDASKTAIAVKKKSSTHDKTIKAAAPENTSKKSSGSPVEIAITALAVGVCLYSFSKKFLFKQNSKSSESRASTPA